jgi:hypothetical protein
MSGTILTGAGVTLGHWAALRGAVKLETKGLKHSSGRSMRSLAKRQLGLPARTSDEALLAALEAKIKEVGDSLTPGDVESF